MIGSHSAPRVLVVDDEVSVRVFAEHALRQAGFEVMAAANGPEALKLVDRHPPFDLFVIDVQMPMMRGDELARRLRRHQPDVKVLYFTGFADLLFDQKQQLWEHEAFVEKPVTPKGLCEAASLLLFGQTGHQPATRNAPSLPSSPSDGSDGSRES
jgi:two-component system, cell cycle sensor histidine kinase and response regulator CckA